VNVRRALATTSALTGLVLVAAAAPALAGTTAVPAASSSKTCSVDQLAYVQSRVDAAVKAREVTIDALTRALAARTHVTTGHRATLTSTFGSDASGLRTVDAKVQADMTCAQAITDGRTVVTDFRVYLLLVPQTHLVSASDAGTYAAGQLVAAEPRVQAAIDLLTDQQKKAAAQSALDDMSAQVSAATTSLTGVADGMIALTPADIPAQESTIDAYRAKVAAAHTDLAKALADARALKSLLVGG